MSTTITLTPVSAVEGTTRAEIKAEARHFLDQLAAGRLQDSVEDQFALDEAVTEAYVEYSKKVKCFPSGQLTASSTADQAAYEYSSFDADGRLFEIHTAGYDGRRVLIRRRTWLDFQRPNWRYDSAGTPTILVPDGEQRFTLYPTPSAKADIDVWGWLTADLSTFTQDTDAPAIHRSRCRLLSAYAAYLVAIRFADVPESQARGSVAYQLWLTGTEEAYREIHIDGDVPAVGFQSPGLDWGIDFAEITGS